MHQDAFADRQRVEIGLGVDCMACARTLMLIDDCEVDAELLETAVYKTNAFDRFIHVQNSSLACDAMERERPQVVLIDLKMPGMSGWDVIAEMKRRGLSQSVRWSILSSSSAAGDKAGALEAGAEAYFEKPWDISGYHTIIESIAAPQKASRLG